MVRVPAAFVLLCLAGVAGLTAGAAGRQTAPLDGTWDGIIAFGSVQLWISVVFGGSADAPTGAIDIPQQGATGLPLRDVRRGADGMVHFELPTGAATALFDGTHDGDRMVGRFAQGGAIGTFSLERAAPAVPPAPVGPAPYRQEDVTISSGDVTLGGTLTVPVGPGPYPGVVLLTGSGAQNRDEQIVGFRIFGIMADYLTRRGIAVLRYDDRGVGASTGTLAQATMEDLAADARAALGVLGAEPGVAPDGVGLIGHSEGATVAAIAASRSADVGFIVMLAGPGVRGDAILRQQAETIARAAGATDDQVAEILASHRLVTDAVLADAPVQRLDDAIEALVTAQFAALPAAQRMAIGDPAPRIAASLPGVRASLTTPAMRFLIGFDPADTLAVLRVPVLALFGERDTQVTPAGSADAVRTSLSANARATIETVDEANHLFQRAGSGLVSEYATLEKAFVPGLLGRIADWVLATAGGDSRVAPTF